MTARGSAPVRNGRLAAVAALVAFASPAMARPPSDRDQLRQYFALPAGSTERAPLLKRLGRLSPSRVLGLLRTIEPHTAQAKGAQRFETTVGPYLVIPPAGYTPKKAWPLHIALHGHGSAQTAHIACERYWQGEPSRHGTILACPDLRDRWTTPRAEQLVIATYKDVQQRFNIATDRVSLGGFSGGGIGTWLIGPEYPDLFAALVARAGIPPRADEVIANLNGLPIYVVHGKGDPTIDVSNSRRAVEALDRLKIEHVYKEMAGSHEFFGKLNDPILDWLATKKRKLRPSFRYRGRLGGERRIVHWLELVGSGVVTVNARIEKRRKIVISLDDSSTVKRVVLHLSRKLVDLRRRQIEVAVGKRRYTLPIKETVAEVLDSYDITRDLRRVYTVRLEITLRR